MRFTCSSLYLSAVRWRSCCNLVQCSTWMTRPCSSSDCMCAVRPASACGSRGVAHHVAAMASPLLLRPPTTVASPPPTPVGCSARGVAPPSSPTGALWWSLQYACDSLQGRAVWPMDQCCSLATVIGAVRQRLCSSPLPLPMDGSSAHRRPVLTILPLQSTQKTQGDNLLTPCSSLRHTSRTSVVRAFFFVELSVAFFYGN